MYFDADHFYGRILAVEKSANKSFPDYKRGIAKVREMMANEPNVDAIEVVRCEECYWRGYCTTEAIFKNAQLDKSKCYCGIGKREEKECE